ncbi:aminotransferase class IV [Microbulbifer sp. SAOS-129_SWC]|uniref:aminotransferase class IV n=1 Tax=Microbulbifer sp. SAOS-129_SWC TaxID=3145235 RepID=UPI0032169A02
MSTLPQFHADGAPVPSLPADAAYSGGLLETMRCQRGRVPLWPLHRARLERSGQIDSATLDTIEAAVSAIARDCPAEAAKLRLRLGLLEGQSHWDLALTPLEPTPELTLGVRLFPCETRLLASETANPGCKSLQRAGYNRAKGELPQLDRCDGLLRDDSGRAIESLRCNLLLYRGNRWLTPDLSRCGVRGVMRDWLGARISLAGVDVQWQALLAADEVALCNSVRGVLPVVELLGERRWAVGPQTRRLQQLIAEELW